MIDQLRKLLLSYFVITGTITLSATVGDPAAELFYLKGFQYADVAGVGTAVENHGNSLVIDVKNYWFGSFATNPITIDGAGLLPDSTNYYHAKNIVFFAMTNEWKSAVPTRPSLEFVIWDSSVAFTNLDGYCSPKFVSYDPPTWFALETNDVEHLAFFSNVVKSIVVAKDMDLLYTTLRDAVKSDESGKQPYKGMAFMPLWELTWRADETNLVKMLYDPLLTPKFRRSALSQLKKRFDWPATNTVPEP